MLRVPVVGILLISFSDPNAYLPKQVGVRGSLGAQVKTSLLRKCPNIFLFDNESFDIPYPFSSMNWEIVFLGEKCIHLLYNRNVQTSPYITKPIISMAFNRLGTNIEIKA